MCLDHTRPLYEIGVVVVLLEARARGNQGLPLRNSRSTDIEDDGSATMAAIGGLQASDGGAGGGGEHLSITAE